MPWPGGAKQIADNARCQVQRDGNRAQDAAGEPLKGNGCSLERNHEVTMMCLREAERWGSGIRWERVRGE